MLATGVFSSEYTTSGGGTRRVTYRSRDEIRAEIAILEGQLAAENDTVPVKRIALGVTSGFSA
jgi:hypothetical protein